MDDDREANMFAHKYMILSLAGVILLAFSNLSHAEAASAAMLKNGEEQFDENCSVCHQAQPEGLGDRESPPEVRDLAGCSDSEPQERLRARPLPVRARARHAELGRSREHSLR